jgi:hypothetical protein
MSFTNAGKEKQLTPQTKKNYALCLNQFALNKLVMLPYCLQNREKIGLGRINFLEDHIET